MLKSLALFLSALALTAPAVAQTPVGQPYSWRAVAIGGGGFVSGILFHPTEPDLVYARTDVGGAYRWDVPRQEWIALNDDIGGLDNEFMRLGVLSLAVDPNDPDRLYLACGQYVEWWASTGVILRSDDRGATWTRTTLTIKLGGNQDGRNTGERLVVDPNNGDILYLGSSQNGLWKSTDRGATWNQVTSFTPTSCTLVLVDPLSVLSDGVSQTIYAGVNSTTGPSLYRSTNGGASWAAVPGQPAGLMPHHADIATLSGTRYLYLAYANALGPNGASAGAVWRHNLINDTWTNVTPVAGAWGYGGVSVDASNPFTVVASTFDRWGPRDEIYRSTDGGASWSPVLQTGTLDHTQAPWAAASTPHWTTDVKIDPFNSARAMFVTGYGLFETTNLGDPAPVWKFNNEGLEETVPLGIISPPSGAQLISALGDIDGFRHDDLTVEPASRHTPLRGTNRGLDFAEALPSKMVRTFDGGTRGAYSTDGGTSWTEFGSAAVSTAYGGAIAISADGATIVWSQEDSAARRSINNGASWTPCVGAPSSTSATYAPVADRANAAKFYIYSQTAGRVYVSTDAGANFTAAATVPTGAAALRAVPGIEGNLWLPCRGSGLRRSTDSGANFTQLSGVQEAYSVGFGRAAPGQAHPAVFLWGRIAGVTGIFRSDDVGATWTRVNDDRHQFGYIGLIIGDPRVFGRVYVAGSGRGVVYGEIPAVLPAYAWATFTTGVAGSWIPPEDTSPYALTFSATDLPAWASVNADTGAISGTPAVSAGTIAQATLIASAGGQVMGTTKVNLVVARAGDDIVPVNMSTRGRAGVGDEIMIPGFVVAGSGSRTFLIRAVGPTLELDHGVTGALSDPRLSLVDKNGIELFFNDDWNSSSDLDALRAAFTSTGAFALREGSTDAALLATVAPGSYTTKVSGRDGGTGVALVEVYDATPGETGATLVNISCRTFVGAGDDVMIPGLVPRGGGAGRFLVRAVGPTLGKYGVNGCLADPEITIYKGATPLARNDDWEIGNNGAEIVSVSQSVGAFALPAGSRDSVLLTSLAESIGGYTIVVSGRGNSTGIALVEVYVVP